MTAELKTTIGMLVAVVLVAAVTDVWKGKIYNWLTLPVLLLAPIWHFATRQLPGLWFSLAGFGVTAGILIALGLLAGRGLGGGDLKLLAAIGALGGMTFVLWALLFTALSGPVVAIPAMMRRRAVGYTLKNFGANLASRYGAGRTDVVIGEGSKAGRVPFGVCICLGTLIALFHPGLHW